MARYLSTDFWRKRSCRPAVGQRRLMLTGADRCPVARRTYPEGTTGRDPPRTRRPGRQPPAPRKGRWSAADLSLLTVAPHSGAPALPLPSPQPRPRATHAVPRAAADDPWTSDSSSDRRLELRPTLHSPVSEGRLCATAELCHLRQPLNTADRQGQSRWTCQPDSGAAWYLSRSCSRFSRPCQNSTVSGVIR